MNTFNAYQYDDLLSRSQDLYANTKYDIIMTYLGGAKALNILNAGCGSGELCLQLAQAGHHVVGIDPAPEYIQLARANAARSGLDNCTFAVSAIEDFVPDGTFDCIMATDVLEHIDNDRIAFERMIRFVRPGGLVILTVPAGPWLFGYHDEALGHYRRYSRVRLRRLVCDLCHVDTIRYFGFSLIPVCYLYSKLLRKPYPVAQAGNSSKNPVVAMTLKSLLRLDRNLPMPFGTSLILKGARKRAA